MMPSVNLNNKVLEYNNLLKSISAKIRILPPQRLNEFLEKLKAIEERAERIYTTEPSAQKLLKRYDDAIQSLNHLRTLIDVVLLQADLNSLLEKVSPEEKALFSKRILAQKEQTIEFAKATSAMDSKLLKDLYTIKNELELIIKKNIDSKSASHSALLKNTETLADDASAAFKKTEKQEKPGCFSSFIFCFFPCCKRKDKEKKLVTTQQAPQSNYYTLN